MIYDRHFTPEQANRLLPKLKTVLRQLRDARDLLTDAEAHDALSEAAPQNGGGAPGRQVGAAFLEVRSLLIALQSAGVVIRVVDRGLVDFPAVLGDREVFLCWELGEDEVCHWHDLEDGYRGRQPLE